MCELKDKQVEEATGGEKQSLKVIVPNVIGKSFEDAKSELASLGLLVDSKYDDSSLPKDFVIISDPLPGISVNERGKVILTLSTGKK